MKPHPTQFLLMHCPAAVVNELDELCRQNYLTRTELLVIALRTMAEYLEGSGAQAPERWQRALMTLPGDLDEYDGDEEDVLLAAEEEMDSPHDIPQDAEIENIALWADQISKRRG